MHNILVTTSINALEMLLYTGKKFIGFQIQRVIGVGTNFQFQLNIGSLISGSSKSATSNAEIQ